MKFTPTSKKKAIFPCESKKRTQNWAKNQIEQNIDYAPLYSSGIGNYFTGYLTVTILLDTCLQKDQLKNVLSVIHLSPLTLIA